MKGGWGEARRSGAGLSAAARVARLVWHAGLDVVLPQSCMGCGAWIAGEQGDLCGECRREVAEARSTPFCARCGRTLPPAVPIERDCRGCRPEEFWNVAGVARCGPYGGVLATMLKNLKYAGHMRNAGRLGAWLAEAIGGTAWGEKVELLVPVPMHWLRRVQRPCNHARVLAEAAGRLLGVPVRNAAVRRAHYAPSQTSVSSRAGRFENIRGCFEPARGADVKGRTVCIVDNLMVSGATIHEVSKVLRAAGAKRIYAATVARSTLPGGVQSTGEAAG